MCLLKCLATLIGIDAAMVVAIHGIVATLRRTLATVVVALVRRLLRPRVVASVSASQSSKCCPSASLPTL